ncbi:hypothetical protein GGI12_005076, partial [Dipsacomyces acuminosporus]
ADNGDDGAEQDEEGLVSGSQNKADDTGDIRPAARLLDIDREIWSSRRSRINGELANRIYGLKFSAPERKRINDSGRPSNYHKQDLMSDVSEPTDDGTQQQPKHSPPSIIPFILARFYCREVVQVVAGHDGIAAIIYEGGVFAIVDCVGQSTLLVDNLNQSPEKTQTAKDVFTAAIAPPQLDVENAPAEQAAKAAFSKEVETITAANIVRFSKPSLGDGSAAGEKNADAASEDHFAVGTSRGYVSLYPIFGSSPPQTQAWPCTGPILYLEMETIACSSAKEESKGTPPHMLVVGTHTAVTVHDGFTPTPVFRHTSPKNTHFLGMRIVKLQTGWHGVAAVDAQANVTLLSLPELREECVLPIPGAKEVIASVNIGISADGHISLLGPNALLIQASIAEAAGTPADKEKRSFFDASLESPQRPVRKGITSWLFGKTSSSSQDIDSFFHEHFRDLLAGGGTCPGAHLRQTEAPPSLSSAPGPSSEPSKAAEIDRSIDPSGFSEARSMLDKREERLGDIDQKDRYIDPSIDATAIAVDPVQGSMAVGHANGQIKLFARKYPSSSKVCTLNRTPVVHLAFIPDQAALAAIDEQGYLWVFDTDTLQLCFSYKVPSVPTAIALIAGTSWLALGTEIGRVYFVDVVNSRKSDFSIGCQVQPPSHVASVEPHPVETERLLVAYSGGGCVVCDIGKASLSEKAMVVARYTFEHPDNLKQEFNHTDATPRIIEPQLTGAGWSPSGEHIAAVYDNGILCVFSANTASRPVVARTIAHPDIFSAEDAAATSADLERGMRCLGHVR